MQEISGSQLIGLGPSCALIGTVTFNECASIAAWLEQNKVRYISMPFLNESTLQTAQLLLTLRSHRPAMRLVGIGTMQWYRLLSPQVQSQLTGLIDQLDFWVPCSWPQEECILYASLHSYRVLATDPKTAKALAQMLADNGSGLTVACISRQMK